MLLGLPTRQSGKAQRLCECSCVGLFTIKLILCMLLLSDLVLDNFSLVIL